MTNLPQKTILHIIDTTGAGGAETVFINIIEKATLEGYRNLALIKGSGWLEQQLKNRGIEYTIIKPHGLLSIPYYFDLFRLFKQRKVAIVQAHLLGATLTSSIVCLFCRIPLVATLHGQVDIDPHEKFVFLKQRLIATSVQKFIAVSSHLAEYIHNRGLFDRKKIDVIYNGIDTVRYYKQNIGNIKTLLKINPDSILIGSLGNIRPAKNYEILIEAASIINKDRKHKAVHFLIAGHQRVDLMQKLNALSDNLNITPMIHFLGFLDDTPKFLSELDIFLLCSSSEGFSIATIEAMAAELPVIATRCGGPEEIITNGINGILIENNNPNAIAETTRLLIDNKKLSTMLSIAGKEHVLSTFSLEVMIDQYVAVYKNLLERKDPLSNQER